jgi:hypothetical protein
MKTKELLNHASKYTLFAAAIMVVYLLLMWIVGGNILTLNNITFIIQAFAIIFFSVKAINIARKDYGEGYISYFNAFFLCFIISFFSLLIFLLVKLLIFYVLDPNYLNNMLTTMVINLEMQKEMIPERWQSYMEPDNIYQAYTFKYQLGVALTYLIESAILALILAGIIKKSPSINENM